MGGGVASARSPRRISPRKELLLDTPRPELPRADDTPWIETPAGGLFFLNAVVVAPALTVLVPLVLGALLRGIGVVEGPSRMLDTIPRIATYFAPRVGWMAAPAAWLAWQGVRRVHRPGPRAWLALFLAVHLATLGYTVWRWVAG